MSQAKIEGPYQSVCMQSDQYLFWSSVYSTAPIDSVIVCSILVLKYHVTFYAPAIRRMVERAYMYSVTPVVRLSVCVHVRDGISNLRLRFPGISNLRLRRGHPCPLDTFIVFHSWVEI